MVKIIIDTGRKPTISYDGISRELAMQINTLCWQETEGMTKQKNGEK